MVEWFMTKEQTAMEACRALVLAYERGEVNGGSVEWSDLDSAVEVARRALGEAECEQLHLSAMSEG